MNDAYQDDIVEIVGENNHRAKGFTKSHTEHIGQLGRIVRTMQDKNNNLTYDILFKDGRTLSYKREHFVVKIHSTQHLLQL